MLTSVRFSRPPHCAGVFGKKCSFFSNKLDIFRYFKNPPGLKYDDQKGGHVRVKPDYMVGLVQSLLLLFVINPASSA